VVASSVPSPSGAGETMPVQDGHDDALPMLQLVRRSRGAAVCLTLGVAIVSFVLSLAALRDLAKMSAWPEMLSWGVPLMIDGTLVLATVGIVPLVSVGGNALHAWLITEQLPHRMRTGSAGLACVVGNARY
jgi:hypothetical protein